MKEVSKIKIKEIARLTGINKTALSNYFKGCDNSQVLRKNKRMIGVYPDAIEEYFKSLKINYYYVPSIILSANLCGGVGKTTSIYNLGSSLRRISGKSSPIVYIDGDSQGSFTSLLFGKPADTEERILIDYLEKKAKIEDILVQVDENTWFIKSNLNQIWIDRILSKPIDIKKSMLHLYNDIFNKLGKNTKIFQDHTPQLSSLFASSICALHQLDKSILRTVIIPVRGDKFAIQGGEYILKEIKELKETFSLENDIDIHCFLSGLDRRISTAGIALQMVIGNEELKKYVSPVVIRYSSEISKSIMRSSNVFYTGKETTASQDYQDLLQYIYAYKKQVN